MIAALLAHLRPLPESLMASWRGLPHDVQLAMVLLAVTCVAAVVIGWRMR